MLRAAIARHLPGHRTGASATRPASGYDVAMMDTRGAASGAFTAQAVADGETAGRPELDLDELRKAEAERRRMLDNLPVRRPSLFPLKLGVQKADQNSPIPSCRFAPRTAGASGGATLPAFG